MRVEEIRKAIIRNLSNPPDLFIRKVETDPIVINEKSTKAGLKKVIITDIPVDDFTQDFWILDLEREIKGFKPIGRTVEKALVHQIDDKLIVYLIELKTHLIHKPRSQGSSTLDDIYYKFEDTISRFYYLVTLHNHHRLETFTKWNLIFCGLIFYNSRSHTSTPESNKLYKILTDNSIPKLLECSNTSLGKEKIQIKFLQNPRDEEEMTVSFDRLK